MIDLERALTLARETGEPYFTSRYHCRVAKGPDERFLRLALVRLIGQAEREQACNVSRDTGEELEFRQRCARAWKALEDRHAAARKETGI